LRRFLRVAPLYSALTAFMLLAFTLKPGLLRSFSFEWPHVLGSFAFWPRPVSSCTPSWNCRCCGGCNA